MAVELFNSSGTLFRYPDIKYVAPFSPQGGDSRFLSRIIIPLSS
jgi:hypothetical protein